MSTSWRTALLNHSGTQPIPSHNLTTGISIQTPLLLKQTTNGSHPSICQLLSSPYVLLSLSSAQQNGEYLDHVLHLSLWIKVLTKHLFCFHRLITSSLCFAVLSLPSFQCMQSSVPLWCRTDTLCHVTAAQWPFNFLTQLVLPAREHIVTRLLWRPNQWRHQHHCRNTPSLG